MTMTDAPHTQRRIIVGIFTEDEDEDGTRRNLNPFPVARFEREDHALAAAMLFAESAWNALDGMPGVTDAREET